MEDGLCAVPGLGGLLGRASPGLVLDVGAQERLRVGDGVVVVGLRGVVHDRVMARDDAVEQSGVADVAHDELHAVGGQPGDVLGVAGVGQLVQDGDVDVGWLSTT